MVNWFYHPENQFHMWNTAHVATIAIAILCVVGLLAFRQLLTPHRRAIRLTVGWTLLISHVSLDSWYFLTGEWDIRSSLPFELSSIATILCGVMLLSKNRFLLDIFYFIAIGSAVQAILTPELEFGFPQFRYIQFFLDHTLVILAPLIMIGLYGYSITFRSLMRAFFALNVIALVVYGMNKIFDANYMFLMHKPNTASVLDFLGPHPYYLLSLEVVTFVIFVILYVPFARRS